MTVLNAYCWLYVVVIVYIGCMNWLLENSTRIYDNFIYISLVICSGSCVHWMYVLAIGSKDTAEDAKLNSNI